MPFLKTMDPRLHGDDTEEGGGWWQLGKAPTQGFGGTVDRFRIRSYPKAFLKNTQGGRMQKTTTVRFEQDTLALLDQLAGTLGRPRSWIINDAVTRYLEYEVWFIDEVRKGLHASEAGDLVTHDEVKNAVRSLGIAVD